MATPSTTLPTPSVDLRRSADRFATDLGWLDSKHSFPFGHHRDPASTHFALLPVANGDLVAPEVLVWEMHATLG